MPLFLQRALGASGTQPSAALEELFDEKDEGVDKTKLFVNDPGDSFEKEPDHVAEQVMRTPAAPAVGNGGAPLEDEETALRRVPVSSAEIDRTICRFWWANFRRQHSVTAFWFTAPAGDAAPRRAGPW